MIDLLCCLIPVLLRICMGLTTEMPQQPNRPMNSPGNRIVGGEPADPGIEKLHLMFFKA